MHYKLLPHLWYTISSAAGCDVDCSNGISIHLPANFQHFLFADMESIDVSGEATVTQNPPNFTPYSESRGEEWTSDLNVGHAAADAVAAVCTLTLGDLGTGGTLADSNGQSVELDAPHAYATGSVDIADATEAGSIQFGEHEAIEFAKKAAALARAAVTPLESYEAGVVYYLDMVYNPQRAPWNFEWTPAAVSTPQDFADALNDVSNWLGLDEIPFVAALDEDTGKVVFTVLEPGAAGNVYQVQPNTAIQDTVHIQFSGGTDARTPQDVVDILNTSADCPAVAQLDADELGITLTATEYGVNDTIAITGSLFENAIGMSGGHGDYTLAELLEAIGTGFTDITPAEGAAEGTITLTANIAGKAANTITYTATGCFGSGNTRQGSTTRGRDAVLQTDYKIYLNGAPLDVEPAPLPTALTRTTAMRNSSVYTVPADGTALDFSTVTLLDNATAEVWIECTAATNIMWPNAWLWLDGAAPSLEAGNRYRLAFRNEGETTVARVTYNYTTPAQS